MRVPLLWLREYCDPHLDVAAIEERLTMTGTKVEAVLHHGVRSPERFVIGRVVAVEAHPDADRLRVCEVDLGEARPDGPATIVCGAPNVAAGQTVAVAQPGAVMPDGTKLAKAKLRGVVSEGMILAEDELSIGADHAGIMVLDGLVAAQQLLPGQPLTRALEIDTDVLELEITPNRPDCLGVFGVARELHAATGAPLAPPPWSTDPGSDGRVDGATVTVECPELCPRFTARVFDGVTVGPSPLWLKARLAAAGQRPINNVVDITNYVMLATGQPLHAFDLDRVAGGHLTVRRARSGELMQTLDGQTRTLDNETVVIEDQDGPTSIAGLMGGARSEVSSSTSRVLLEVANFSGPNIHRSSWALGLRSEASSRFEKGLAPEACAYAQALASRLMIELCGARLAPGTIDVGTPVVDPPPVRLRAKRLRSILGMDVATERQAHILRALDFDVKAAGTDGDDEQLLVGVPPLRRQDITREADLIEEIARIAGLDELPATLPARRGAYGVLSHEQRLRRRAVDALVGCGLYQVMGWTFTSPDSLDRLRLADDHPLRRVVGLQDPLSSEHSVLRSTLLSSLQTITAHNLARGVLSLGIFEVGTVFALDMSSGGANGLHDGAAGVRDGATGVREHSALGVLMSGPALPATWRASAPPKADFFAVKGVLEALAEALGVGVDCVPADPDRYPFLHPARAAEVLCGGAPIGWLGELHPLVETGDGAYGNAAPAAMELDLDLLVASAASARHDYRELISYPPLRRDLAVVLPEHVAAARVELAVRESGAPMLEDVRIFDVYTGPQVGEKMRSLALALAFRDPQRTLSDTDIEPVWTQIVAALGELGGELRA
jgi:phenylalanyl-tRNA synthetase beta chain